MIDVVKKWCHKWIL